MVSLYRSFGLDFTVNNNNDPTGRVLRLQNKWMTMVLCNDAFLQRKYKRFFWQKLHFFCNQQSVCIYFLSFRIKSEKSDNNSVIQKWWLTNINREKGNIYSGKKWPLRITLSDPQSDKLYKHLLYFVPMAVHICLNKSLKEIFWSFYSFVFGLTRHLLIQSY